MLKDILTLMLAIVLSFTTSGSVQDERHGILRHNTG